MVRAVVIKMNRSYALQVPKRYVKENHLEVGDTVTIEEPLVLQQNALAALVRHSKERGPIRATMDPVQWQQVKPRSNLGNETAHGSSEL